MKHLGTQTIETGRLILRRFTVEDARAMYENWASDEEVTKYLTWPVHDSAAVTRAVLEDWTARYDGDSFYQWAIVFREHGDSPIGSISVVSYDEKVQKAEIGYCIGRAWWHKGIMTEALGAVINFLFHEVGMQRVEARHDIQNPNSGAVMRKCGMQYEGTARRAGWNNQGVCDLACYAILAADRRPLE